MIWMFVIVSLPRLKSWIVSWDLVSVKSSAKRSLGFGFRSSCCPIVAVLFVDR